MVDALVSFVVQRLGDFLIQEAVFLREVRNEVKSLKKELEWMSCFVRDAEEKQVDDPMIRQWVSDIRDVAHDTENVLDNFMLTVHDEEEGENRKKRSGFLASMNICSCIFDQESNLYRKSKKEVDLYNIGKDIEDLRKRVADISRRRESYGLQSIDSKSEAKSNNPRCRLKELRRATSYAVEENVVGFEDDFRKLLAKLLDREPCRLVISIYGMGGLGKTTLARKLYHNNDIKNKFDCFAWVSVSQEYKTEDLLLSIIRSFKTTVLTGELKEKRAEDLERYLHKSLQGKSYLVVVDDVWHKEAWESLKRAFPDNKNGSRVIITTRIKEVAERSDEKTYAHNLRFLRPDESWELFCSKAFRSSDEKNGLEKLGREMVEKCHGLPLAIVVLGGLLSTKKPQEWRTVRDHIWRHLKNDSIHISYLLTLSFNNLSYQLKLCFLYLGLFPEDFEIKVQNLIRLFVAEGLIEQENDRSMEEVAKGNIDELINRSLVQIEKRSWGKVATCRVHDLLRDLAIEKAKEINFIHICVNSSSSRRSSCPRQAVHFPLGWDCDLTSFNSFSTSLLLFNQRWDPSVPLEHYLEPLCRRFISLRVLDFDGILNNVLFSARRCDNLLPEEIGKFIHLKYFRLRNADVGGISSFIAKLKRLQTLDISGETRFIELPGEICELKELRHLIGNFTGTLMIESLSNLQTLKYITHRCWRKINPEKLVSLQELHIVMDRLEEAEDFTLNRRDAEAKEFTFDSIARLKNLQLLSVNHISFGSLQPLSHCSCLVDLRLTGKIEKLPGDMYELLPNLQCLSLKKSYLKYDPMPTLEKLPNLTILDLRFNAYCGGKMICTTKGFHLLETLQIIDSRVMWEVEEGAMPMLRSLRVPEICKLGIPERLKSLPLPAEWECDENW